TVATGTVKGFAITLILGILASLFSALLVTRVCFSWAVNDQGGWIKKLNFANFAPKRQFDFLSKRRLVLAISTIAVLFSMVVAPIMDTRGVDLKGGDLLTIHSAGEISKAKIDETLREAGFEGVYVQKQTAMADAGEFITVRSEHGLGAKIQTTLVEALGL